MGSAWPAGPARSRPARLTALTAPARRSAPAAAAAIASALWTLVSVRYTLVPKGGKGEGNPSGMHSTAPSAVLCLGSRRGRRRRRRQTTLRAASRPRGRHHSSPFVRPLFGVAPRCRPPVEKPVQCSHLPPVPGPDAGSERIAQARRARRRVRRCSMRCTAAAPPRDSTPWPLVQGVGNNPTSGETRKQSNIWVSQCSCPQCRAQGLS